MKMNKIFQKSNKIDKMVKKVGHGIASGIADGVFDTEEEGIEYFGQDVYKNKMKNGILIFKSKLKNTYFYFMGSSEEKILNDLNSFIENVEEL